MALGPRWTVVEIVLMMKSHLFSLSGYVVAYVDCHSELLNWLESSQAIFDSAINPNSLQQPWLFAPRPSPPSVSWARRPPVAIAQYCVYQRTAELRGENLWHQLPTYTAKPNHCESLRSINPSPQLSLQAASPALFNGISIRKTPPRNFPAFSRKFVQNILNSLNEQIVPEYVTPQENIVNSATYEQNFFGVASSLWNYFGVFTFLRSRHIERKHYLLVSTIKGEVFPVPSRQIQSPSIAKEITSLAEPEAAGATPGWEQLEKNK
ncbi:hypothetical protein B0H14DRAFT_2654300 [Mycena olivaceomarginata]|nr:hypothetical protein B0H14DRAFT_2654300 [Mycena olivaceomarginata]